MVIEFEKILKSFLKSEGLSDVDREHLQSTLRNTNQHLRKVEITRREEKLNQSVGEFKTEKHTSKLVKQVWEDYWSMWSSHSGRAITVSQPDVNTREVEEIENGGEMLIFVPEEVSSDDSRRQLMEGLGINHIHFEDGLGYSSGISKLDNYKNLSKQSGWLKTESGSETPNQGIGLEAMRELEKDGKGPMTFNTYIVASSFSNLVDEPLDEAKGGWMVTRERCALTGTKSQEGDVLCAASQGMIGGLAVSVADSGKLDEYALEGLGVRLVRRIDALAQKKLF